MVKFWSIGKGLLISKYFHYTGSTDGRIHCWNTETGAKMAVMSCDHPGPVQCCQFNPKYMMLASSCTNMVSKYVI